MCVAIAFTHLEETERVEWLRPQGTKRKRGASYARGFSWGGAIAVQRAALSAHAGVTFRHPDKTAVELHVNRVRDVFGQHHDHTHNN